MIPGASVEIAQIKVLSYSFVDITKSSCCVANNFYSTLNVFDMENESRFLCYIDCI